MGTCELLNFTDSVAIQLWISRDQGPRALGWYRQIFRHGDRRDRVRAT
jgi:hypothetical protein